MSSRTAKTDSGFLCLECGKVLATKRGLKRHARDLHVFRNVWYRCPACGAALQSKNTFCTHLSAYHKELKGVDVELFARTGPPEQEEVLP